MFQNSWLNIFRLGLCGWLCCAASLIAQEPLPSGPPAQRVFVPLEELEQVLRRDQEGVLLPREKFAELQALADKNSQPTAPVAYAVQNVDYDIRLADDQLLMTAKLQVRQFQPGWQALHLALGDLQVEQARWDDQPARLARDPAQPETLVLFINDVGLHTLTLEFSRPLAAVGSDLLTSFRLAPVPNAHLTVHLPPEKHLVWNGLPLERPAASDQPAAYELAVGGQNQIELRVTDRPTEQSAAGLLFAHTVLGLQASPGEVTWQAVTNLQVFGKGIDQIQFRVPEALQIVAITSPGLESWEFGEQGPENGQHILNLRYRQAVQGNRDIQFKAVLETPVGDSWVVPALSCPSANAHSTEIVIRSPAGVRVQVEEMLGVNRVAAADSQPGAPVLHYAAWRENFVLRLVTQSKAREVSAALATVIDMLSSGLTLDASLVVETRIAPLFEVTLRIPAEWTITAVTQGDQHLTWESVPTEAGMNVVRIPLPAPLAADQSTTLLLQARRLPEGWPVAEEPMVLDLPELQLLEANVVEGTVVIRAEPQLDLLPLQLRGLEPDDVAAAQAQARLGYAYQDVHYGGQLQISRKPARISAVTLAFHRSERNTRISHLEARVQVSGGGVRKLTLAVPADTGDNVQWTLATGAANIIEQTAAAPQNGQRLWTLMFDQHLLGPAIITTDLRLPKGNEATWSPPTVRVVGADREIGYLVLEAEPDQRLGLTARTANGLPLADVDTTDLPAPYNYTPRERIVAAYNYVLPGYQLSVTEERYGRQAIPTAVCDRMQLTSVLGPTGEFQHVADFQFRVVGVQSLRVTLPPEAELWATLIDDQPIEVRQGDQAYLIPLTTGIEPGSVHHLKLFYRTQVGELQAAGRLVQSPPDITVLNGDGTTQPLEVLQREWTVHHPAGTEFVDVTGDFTTSDTSTSFTWLGRLLRRFEVDSPWNLLQKLAWVAGLIVVIVLVRLAIMNRGVVIAILLVSGIALLFGVVLPTVVPSLHRAEKAATSAAPYPRAYSEALMSAPVADFGEEAPSAHYLHDDVQYTPAPDGFTIAQDEAKSTKDQLQAGQPESRDKSDFDAEIPKPAMTPPESRSESGRRFLLETERNPAGFQRGGTRSESAAEGEMKQSLSELQNGQAQPMPQAPPAPGDDPFGPANAPAEEAPQPRQEAGEGAQLQQNFAQGAQGQPLVPPRGSATLLGAVLSLSLDLQPPAGSVATDFKFRGRGVAQTPQWRVLYQNRYQLSFVGLSLQVLIVVLCWIIRRWPWSSRLALAVIGLGAPLALVTVVPPNWLPYLDAVLMGTAWGLLVWLIWGFVCWFTPQKLWHRLNQPLSGSSSSPTDGTGSGGSWLSRLFARRVSLWFLLTMLPASSLWAQPAAEPPALVPVPADREIIPYELSEKPEDSKRVYLPWKQFHELWVKAHPEQVPQLAAPVAGQLAEALYSAELPDKAQAMGDSLTIQGRLVYYVLQQGQVTLPLPLGAVAMEQAQVNGEQAVIVPTPGEAAAQNPLSVVFDQPGVYVVDLRFRVKVRQTGPAGAVTLPLTAVPAGTFRLKTPAGALQYRVNGSSQGFRKVQDADQPALIVPISAGGNVTVAWRPPQEAQDTESFVQAESVTAVIVTDQGLRLQAQQKLQVRQGGINEVVFSFPEPLALRTLSGADVGGWQIEGEGAERTLTVFLRRKVDDGTQLRFDLFLKQSADDMETQYAIPDFAPKSVARETGTIAVLAPRQFSIRLGDSTGLQQIEATQVPWQPVVADVSVPEVPQFAFRFTRRPLQWSLVVQRRQPQLTLLAEHLAALSPRRIQQTNKFHFELKGAPRSELLIVLPQGYLPQQIQAPDVTDWHISGRDNAAEMDAEALLHLDLGTPRTGPVEVTLIGKLLRDPQDTQVQVALPYALEAEDYVSHALVTIDPIYEAKTGELDTWRSVDPAGMFSAWFSRTVTGRPMAFTTNAPAPAPFELQLNQAQPRLSADALTIVTVQEQALEYLVALQWRITSAGADTFVFTTPQWLADHLEFPEVATPRIRSVHKEPPLDGVVRWTITLEDPQRDRLFLAARATLPPSAQGEVRAPRIVFEQAAPAGAVQPFTPLELQKQYAVLVNRSATQLTRAPADGVEAIAADDLLQVIKLRQDLLNEAAELLRINDPSAVVTWKQQRFQAEQLLPASVNLAQHVTVLALDGSWRSVSHFRLKNRSRQFLPLRLPADSQILSIIVRDEPGTAVQPPAPAGVTLVPLPKTVEGDVSFMVQLVLAGRLPSGPLARRWSLWPQTVQIPVPQILSTEEDPALGIPVAQTTWTVYAPEATDVWFVHDPNAMNVTPGSEAVTQLDELSALMQEMSDLVNVNSSSGNRRAQAQSLNNLKYLNPLVQKAVEQQQQTPSKGGRNAEQEEARKAELVQRAKRLEKTVEEVFRFNEDKGLQVNTDSLGNNYIVDNKQEASQKDRFSQLYSDNTPTVTATPEDMPALNQPEAKPSSGKSQSLGREALREQSRAQVQELSKKNAEKLSGSSNINFTTNALPEDLAGSGQMDGQPQSKELHFQNPFQSQGDSGVAAGPRRDLQRRGDYPKLGTIVGLAQSNTFHPDLDGAIQGNGGGGGMGGMGGAGGPGVAGPGPGGMPGGGTPVWDAAIAETGVVYGGRGMETSLDAFDGGLSQALGVKGWTATGGLSLPLQIPQTGKAWYFSKVGGGPVLTLALRPHQTLQTLFGLLWTVASGTLLAVLVWLLRRSSDWRVWNRWLPWCLTAVGLSLYCLLPVNTSLAGLSFLMLLIGLVWLAANWRPRTTASTR